MSTKDYLNPKWQKKRLEILERDNYTCTQCGDNENTLHVHHSHYVKGHKYWEYSESSLTTLCEHCHKDYHEAIKDIDTYRIKRLSQLIFDFHDFCCDHSEYMKDIVFYRELVLDYMYCGDIEPMGYFEDELLEIDESLDNFLIIEALLFYKIRKRNIKEYVSWCYCMHGQIEKPSCVGKHMIEIKRINNEA